MLIIPKTKNEKKKIGRTINNYAGYSKFDLYRCKIQKVFNVDNKYVLLTIMKKNERKKERLPFSCYQRIILVG